MLKIVLPPRMICLLRAHKPSATTFSFPFLERTVQNHRTCHVVQILHLPFQMHYLFLTGQMDFYGLGLVNALSLFGSWKGREGWSVWFQEPRPPSVADRSLSWDRRTGRWLAEVGGGVAWPRGLVFLQFSPVGCARVVTHHTGTRKIEPPGGRQSKLLVVV